MDGMHHFSVRRIHTERSVAVEGDVLNDVLTVMFPKENVEANDD